MAWTSSGLSEPLSSSRRVRAGRPASSRMIEPPPSVTTYGRPMGRHPWLTTVTTSAPGPSRAPTAPEV